MCLESFPGELDLINSHANISQTEDPFDVGGYGVMLTVGRAAKIKLDIRNRPSPRIAKQAL